LKASAFYHPGTQLENKEQSAILFKAIDQLPEKQKSAFILHKIEGLSYNEIADILNTSLSSVESLLFRAKQNLQQSLSEYYKNNY
jgi:RNA polymerase sigma-70 factor (ECF subfamily)